MENGEPKLKPGSPEYETDVIKRARKAAMTIGKTLDSYRLIGEALSIMRHRAMEAAGLEGSNKPPSGPRYTKALDAELDKAPEFLAPEVFESGSARTHAVWLHDCAADVEWTLQVCERAKPGSTRRWNNPTYIWKQWRKLTKEPTKAQLDAKRAKEIKAEAARLELERYREEWREKYVALKAKYEALTGAEFENGAAEPEGEVIAPKPTRVKRTPKGKSGEADSVGGFGPGAIEAITGKSKRERKAREPLPTTDSPSPMPTAEDLADYPNT